jgi:hypothetical protein
MLCFRENMKNSKYESMLLLRKPRKYLKRGGPWLMALPGLGITPGTILA